MSRFSPTVQPIATPSWSQRIADALEMRQQRQQERKAQGERDQDRTRSQTIQNIGLAKEGVHLLGPGELPPSIDFDLSGGPSADDIVSRAIMPALTPIKAAMPFTVGEGNGGAMPSKIGESRGGPMVNPGSISDRAGNPIRDQLNRVLDSASEVPQSSSPLAITPSRRLSMGNGYYIDNDERDANYRATAEGHASTALAEAIAKLRANEIVNPGAAAADTAYKKALTLQAQAQAERDRRGATTAPVRQDHIVDPVTGEVKFFDPTKPPQGLRVGVKPEKGAAEGGKPTEFSGKAALVTPKGEQAFKILDEFYTKGVPASQGVLSHIPGLGNYAMSADQQRAQQAGEALSMAILRLESGASISDQEMKNQAKQIIPLPGDSPEVLAQKRATAITILQRMKAAAQPSMRGEKAPLIQPQRGTAPVGNVDLSHPAVQTIDQMIQSGASDAEIKAAIQRGVK